MLHIPLGLTTWSFAGWHMFPLPLLWSSSCVAVTGMPHSAVLCSSCTVGFKVQGACCSGSGLIQPCGLQSQCSPCQALLDQAPSLCSWTGRQPQPLKIWVKCQIKIMAFTCIIHKVRAKINGQYLALGVATRLTIWLLSLLECPNEEAAFGFARRILWDSLWT